MPKQEDLAKDRKLLDSIYPFEKGCDDSAALIKEKEVAYFLKLGFTPYFSFYGENNYLKPLVSWYGFYGKKKSETIYIVICANSSKGEYTVYKNNKKMGIFCELEDIIELFHIKEYEPTLPTMYTDFLMFEKDKLGEILKKAKSLMDNQEWNDMVEKAAKEMQKGEPSFIPDASIISIEDLK